jgi:hypothetical protein
MQHGNLDKTVDRPAFASRIGRCQSGVFATFQINLPKSRCLAMIQIKIASEGPYIREICRRESDGRSRRVVASTNAHLSERHAVDLHQI